MHQQFSSQGSIKYVLPPNFIQASKALSLKREIDVLCSKKAKEILKLTEEFPLAPTAYDFNQGVAERDISKVKTATRNC